MKLQAHRELEETAEIKVANGMIPLIDWNRGAQAIEVLLFFLPQVG